MWIRGDLASSNPKPALELLRKLPDPGQDPLVRTRRVTGLGKHVVVLGTKTSGESCPGCRQGDQASEVWGQDGARHVQ